MSEADHAFTVTAARSGISIRVAPEESIARALLAAGVTVRTGCLGGGCGACIVRILAGEADHRDAFLQASERAEGLMAICVSRAKGAGLVLDV